MKKKIKYFFKNLKSEKRKKLLGPHAEGVIYNSENGIIALPVADTTIGKELGFNGNWDIEEIKKLIDNCKAEDVVYIIGTHVGTLLVPLSKKVSQIIGYEANENTFWFAQMNLCLNKIKNTKLFHFAVGDSKRKIKFYQNKVNTGGSKMKPVKDSILYTYDKPNEVEVEMIPLDLHIKENNLPEPSGFIMDIEGAEYFALKGMQKSLEKARFLYIEFVPHHLENVSNTTTAEFLSLISPHFKYASFFKNDKKFDVQKTEILDYMNKMRNTNVADDILFTK